MKYMIGILLLVFTACSQSFLSKESKKTPDIKNEEFNRVAFYITDEGFGSFVNILFDRQIDPKIKSLAILQKSIALKKPDSVLLVGSLVCESQIIDNVIYPSKNCKDYSNQFKELRGIAYNLEDKLCAFDDNSEVHCEDVKGSGKLIRRTDKGFLVNPGLDEYMTEAN